MRSHLFFFFIFLLFTVTGNAQSQKAQEKSDQFIKTDIHLRLDKVSPGIKDTVWLILDGGARLGIKPGLKGRAVSVYNSAANRTYEILASLFVTAVTEDKSKAYMLLPADASGNSYLLEGDQA